MDALQEVIAHVRGCLLAAALEEAVIRRVELVIEELFTNSVTHGYGGDSDAPVWLDCRIEPSALAVDYCDAAPPFDPLQHRPDLEFGACDRPAGGLGVLLARRLADRIDYRRLDGKNVLTLVFRRRG
jgi:anti-sigma regulatory factor (Ser/Thr protein kinase)